MTLYTKLDMAVHQLDKAIELFLAGDHLCCVTLAGAADGLLGVLTRQSGNESAVDRIAAIHAPEFWEDGTPPSKRAIVAALNFARDAAKHADAGGERIVVDWVDACALLFRAIPMARELGVRTAAQDAFGQWCDQNAEMIDSYTASDVD